MIEKEIIKKQGSDLQKVFKTDFVVRVFYRSTEAMHSKKFSLAALFLLISLLITSFAFSPQFQSSAQSTTTGYKLMSTQTFNQYGQYSVNETIVGGSNSTSLSSVTFGFPGSFNAHLVSMTSNATLGGAPISTTISTKTSNNSFLVTLSLGKSLGGQNSTVSLYFWVLDSLKSIDTIGNFTGVALLRPYVNLRLDILNSSISFPYSTTYVSNITGLEHAGFGSATTIITVPVQGQIQDWINVTRNVTPDLKTLTIPIYSYPTSTGSVEFTSVTRQISIATNGQILVRDTLNIRNLGLNTISALAYTPLTTSPTITALPSNEPPLSNVESITISNDQLSLNSTNQQIQPQSSTTLAFQYTLPGQYWSVSGGIYDIKVPTKAPVDAVVDQYRLFSTSVPGIVIYGKQVQVSLANASQSVPATANLNFRVGVASATSATLPLASILFVGVFLAGLVFRPRADESADVYSAFDNLIRAIEDKVSSTNDLLSELQSKGVSVSKNELVIVRSRIDEVRSKAGSRIGVIRSQLPQNISTAVQASLNEVLASDRDFDRIVREILSGYDQLASKRMKEETFARLEQANNRKLQSTTNSLMDKAHDLREEYETEG